MNYYAARQREKDKRWDYTCMNDGRIWPVGYCREHGDGHETKQEAQDCYRKYLLDTQMREVELSDTKRPCVGTGSALAENKCGEWTQKCIEVGHGSLYPLCDAHRNRETIEKLFQVHEITSSY